MYDDYYLTESEWKLVEDVCDRFDSVVVTDWGDMDIVIDGADAVAAGNDAIMPGGPPVIRQILTGLEKGTVTRQNLLKAARHLVGMTTHTLAQKKEESQWQKNFSARAFLKSPLWTPR